MSPAAEPGDMDLPEESQIRASLQDAPVLSQPEKRSELRKAAKKERKMDVGRSIELAHEPLSSSKKVLSDSKVLGIQKY